MEELYDEQVEELDGRIKNKEEELKQKITLVNKCYKAAIDSKNH